MPKKVLDVGQCPPDHQAIRHLLESLGASVDQVALPRDAVDRLRRESFDLVLVNRKIDQDYTDGAELITMLKDAEIDVPVMLVSNFPEAQQQAVTMGALPGFGKSELGRASTRDRINAAFEQAQAG